VWANSVPASVVAAASKKERNRQEAIFEVVNTEHNYVRDLELMEEVRSQVDLQVVPQCFHHLNSDASTQFGGCQIDFYHSIA
jgi:hypothetical protein